MRMEVEELFDPIAFLERAHSLLLADEARHNLILGIAATLRDSPAVYPERRLWVIHDSGTPLAAALRTPPFNLALARPRREAALAALVEALATEELPGVTGALPEADAFAELWRTRTGRRPRVRMRQRIYRANAIAPPMGVPGAARTATRADFDLLVAWLDAFAEEASAGADAPVHDSERWVENRLSGGGGFGIWEDGAPVALAGWGARTPNGVRIGPVYTPPDRRRRGYGSAVTAAVSRERLAAGASFCFLYTDLANPTSNRIYTEIGYEPVCDSVDYSFDAA